MSKWERNKDRWQLNAGPLELVVYEDPNFGPWRWDVYVSNTDYRIMYGHDRLTRQEAIDDAEKSVLRIAHSISWAIEELGPEEP
jgi:hypothetical protein